MRKAERCNNHYVHKGKDFLMQLEETTKVKVSLYKKDAEAAFVIFEKKSIPNDNWFEPSRVIDSYPWDVELLKSSAEMSLEPQQHNQDTRFYIVKSKPGYPLRRRSPHSYWMKIYENSEVDICQYGLIDTPYILYSKGPGPTLLSKSAVSLIINWTSLTERNASYSLTWADAENFCQTHLDTKLPTETEVDIARVNQHYECCKAGCMANNKVGYPMNQKRKGCGNKIGIVRWPRPKAHVIVNQTLTWWE